MPIVKICPACGKQNEQSAWECASCQADLFDVRPTRADDAPAQAAPPSVGHRCAQCGNVYAFSVRQCPTCQTHLSSMPVVPMNQQPPAAAPAVPVAPVAPVAPAVPVVPTVPQSAAQPAAAAYVWRLTSVDHEWALPLNEGQRVLLGGAFMEGNYLCAYPRFDLVSSSHAVVAVRGGRLFITDQSRNGTQINYQLIPRGVETEVSSGSLISLGGKEQFQQNGAAYLIARRVTV